MFASPEKFLVNQYNYIKNNWEWAKNLSPEEFYEGLKSQKFNGLHHNFKHLLNLGILSDEILVQYYKGYTGVTNYRLYYNSDAGITSIPLVKLIKYFDYQCGTSEQIEKAKKFYKDELLGFEWANIIYEDLRGSICSLDTSRLLHPQYIKQVISEGEYLDVNEEEIDSIYKTRRVLSKKYPDLKEVDYDNFISLFKERSASLSSSSKVINPKDKVSIHDFNDDGFLKFIIEDITSLIKNDNPDYSKLVFAFRKIVDGENSLSKETFDKVLINDVDNEYANYGQDLLKCFTITAGNLKANEEIIGKYSGTKKAILDVLNSHLKLQIAKDLFTHGIDQAAEKRAKIQEANLKAAGAILTATASSSMKSKTSRNIGYAAAGGMLLSSGSSRSSAGKNENQEVKLMQAGVSLLSSIASELKRQNNEISNKYISNHFKKIAADIINKYHSLVKVEFEENSDWGLKYDYKEKCESKLNLHVYNFYRVLDYLGFDNHKAYKEKESFDKYFKLINDLSDKLKKKHTLKIIINLFVVLWGIAGTIWLGSVHGGLGIANLLFTLIGAFYISPTLSKHKRHDQLKNLFEKAEVSIKQATFVPDDIDFEKIGIG